MKRSSQSFRVVHCLHVLTTRIALRRPRLHLLISSLHTDRQSVVDLRRFRPALAPNLRWNGGMPGSECMDLIHRCYARAVHWIPNLFKVPFGNMGRPL